MLHSNFPPLYQKNEVYILVLNFAHRGSLTEAPENTLSAIHKALEHQTKAIEIDVQLTKDKQIIVIHDHHFSRLNENIHGYVNDYTLEEIKSFDIGSSFSKAYAHETIATLDEVLDICPKDILLNIEIKNIPIIHDGIEERVIQCLKRHNRLENILISSFDHQALEKVQALDPRIPLGLLMFYRLLRPWEYIQSTRLTLRSVHPNMVYVDQMLVDEMHKIGLEVYPFTVNHIDEYRKLIDLGVNGVFSNNPAIFGL